MSLAASQTPSATFSLEEKRLLRRRLRAWFARSARDLPWRRTRDPYAVWVSEIMLQQTQVATVERYFPRFLAAFPSVAALAEAPEAQVLRHWEGLGYYRRARQLHRAAAEIVARHDGVFPRTAAEVLALPGIGRYTAGAVLSIAFDARLPILEANTVRLYSRLLAETDPHAPAGAARLWAAAEDWLPARGVGLFNQALMELGALVCTPREPDCDRCPVAELCRARRQGRQAELPPPKPRPRREDACEAAVVVTRADGRVLVVRRGEGGRWAGLWDFVRFPLIAERGPALARELAEKVRDAAGLEIAPGARLMTIQHGVTRFRITLHVHRAEPLASQTRPGVGPEVCSGERPAGERRWLLPEELAELPLHVTARRVADLLCAERAP